MRGNTVTWNKIRTIIVRSRPYWRRGNVNGMKIERMGEKFRKMCTCVEAITLSKLTAGISVVGRTITTTATRSKGLSRTSTRVREQNVNCTKGNDHTYARRQLLRRRPRDPRVGNPWGSARPIRTWCGRTRQYVCQHNEQIRLCSIAGCESVTWKKKRETLTSNYHIHALYSICISTRGLD